MSPESGHMERPTILEEAKILTSKILERQLHRQALVDQLEQEDVASIREEMGYAPAEEIDPAHIVNTRVKEFRPGVKAKYLKDALPVTKMSAETTYTSRIAVERIVKSEDDRLVVIIGPCSIHDPEAALEYAEWVSKMRRKYGGNLEIIMRAYVEKPRSELGWKGLMNDPELKDTPNIGLGATVSRLLLMQITGKGVPVAVERVNGRTTQYLDGLVTYDAIGARDILSTRARDYLSVTSAVGGAKNSPDGSIDSAVQAVATANAEHTYLGDDEDGNLAEIDSTGNDTVHVMLRGGKSGPNYTEKHVKGAVQKLRKKGLLEAIGIDASHDHTKQPNGDKDYRLQSVVVEDISRQISLGETAIKIVMIESNLIEGKQNLETAREEGRELIYGQSITDAGVGLEESELMLERLTAAVAARRKQQAQL